jgi:hypothetical protein
MLKIAGIQMKCSQDKEKNLERSLLLAEIAAERGAKMICFQELFNTHWFPMDICPDHFQLAEEIPGPATEAMQQIAQKLEVVIVLPFFEKDSRDLYFNTAVVIDADGKILGKYRKVHIPQIPLWEEKAYFHPGDLLGQFFPGRGSHPGSQRSPDHLLSHGGSLRLSGEMGKSHMRQRDDKRDLYLSGKPGRKRSQTEFLWEKFLRFSGGGVGRPTQRRAGRGGYVHHRFSGD